MVNDGVNFNDLKELLEITDGNLASHLKALEENNIIRRKTGVIILKDRKSTRLNSSHRNTSRMPSSA